MSVSRIRRTPHRLQRLCLGRMKPCVESIGDSFFLTHTHTHSFMRAPQVQWCGPVCGISWYALALSSGNPSNLLTGHRDRDTHTHSLLQQFVLDCISPPHFDYRTTCHVARGTEHLVFVLFFLSLLLHFPNELNAF